MDKSTEGEAVNHVQVSDKPSGWWMLYHFWAGICAKVYVDISGLSKFIVGPSSGSDPASASSYAMFYALVAVGAVGLGYFLSKSLVDFIDKSAMPRKGRAALKSIFPFGYFMVAVLLSAVTAPMFAQSAHIQQLSRPVAQKRSMKPVMAFTTSQDSEGITEEDLDQPALKNLETWIVETMLKKGRDKYAEMGYNPKEFKPRVSANSVYVNVGGKKLAVIKINMGESMRLVTIIGIRGSEVLRVSCIRASKQDIPVWSGECGDEVKKAFGVSIQP